MLALTFIPAAASYLFAARPHVRIATRTRKRTGSFALRARYEAALMGASRIVAWWSGVALAVLAIALASVPFLGTEFMPKLDEGYLLIETRRSPSTSLRRGRADVGGRRAHAAEIP